MTTVREAFDKLWPVAAARVSAGTARGYLSAWRRRVLPTFGDRALTEVTTFDIEHAYVTWSGSRSTRRDALAMLSSLYKTAIKARLVEINPCVGVEERRVQAPDLTARALDRVEVDRLLAFLPSSGVYRRFVLALLYTGCRFGEVAGMRVGDVDLASMTINVQRTASAGAHGEIVIGATKGRRVRNVPVPDPFVPELLAAMEGKGEHDYLFTGPRGGFLSSGNLSRALDWHAHRDSIKSFPPGAPPLHWHDLRHTTATMLFLANTPATDVQAIMGHAHLTTTQAYADTRKDAARRGGAALSAYFAQSKGQLHETYRGGDDAAHAAVRTLGGESKNGA